MDGTQLIQLLGLMFVIVLVKKEGTRPSEMRKLADKYALTFSDPSAQISFTVAPSYKSNIIQGRIRGKAILIYDFNGVPPLKYSFSLGTGGTSITKRFTIVCVDGVEKKVTGWPLGFASTHRIDAILSSISSSAEAEA